MGGKGSSTTNTKSEPWDAQKDYLKQTFADAQNLYQNTDALAPAYFSGNTVAPQSNFTTQAINMQGNRALAGDDQYGSIGNAATALGSYLTDPMQSSNAGLKTLNSIGAKNWNAGDTGLSALNSMTTAVNPYSQKLLRQAIDQQTGQLNGNFSKAGRYGSGAHENAVAAAATNLTNQFYADAYDKQMQAAQAASNTYQSGLQGQAAAAGQAANAYNQGASNLNSMANTAQNIANQKYTDAAALSDAGSLIDEYKQEVINANIDRYNYEQQRPMTALANYINLINGTYGGTSTTTGQNTSRSTLSNVNNSNTTQSILAALG